VINLIWQYYAKKRAGGDRVEPLFSYEKSCIFKDNGLCIRNLGDLERLYKRYWEVLRLCYLAGQEGKFVDRLRVTRCSQTQYFQGKKRFRVDKHIESTHLFLESQLI
jgi:hypothetical protein